MVVMANIEISFGCPVFFKLFQLFFFHPPIDNSHNFTREHFNTLTTKDIHIKILNTMILRIKGILVKFSDKGNCVILQKTD